MHQIFDRKSSNSRSIGRFYSESLAYFNLRKMADDLIRASWHFVFAQSLVGMKSPIKLAHGFIDT